MDQPFPAVAIITGASSGIGIDFARELIQRDYSLLITGRNEERLADVQQKLKREFGGTVETFSIDLSSSEAPASLLDKAQGLGIPKVLINNAGLGMIGNFLEQESDEIDQMIRTNITAVTRLCHLFGREMAENEGGYILNHSSFSAIQPPADYAVYSATKSYLLTLSQALRQNLAEHRVFVTALCSGFFDSDFSANLGQKPGFFIKRLTMKKERVARAGIRGLFKGKTLVIPGFRYKCLNLLSRCVPRSVSTGIANFGLNRK